MVGKEPLALRWPTMALVLISPMPGSALSSFTSADGCDVPVIFVVQERGQVHGGEVGVGD